MGKDVLGGSKGLDYGVSHFKLTALIIWIVRNIIYVYFIGIKQTVYIKPMITRVPVSISVGTRGTRELLMSLLVEALISALTDDSRWNSSTAYVFRRAPLKS